MGTRAAIAGSQGPNKTMKTSAEAIAELFLNLRMTNESMNMKPLPLNNFKPKKFLHTTQETIHSAHCIPMSQSHKHNPFNQNR
jgi:hypothetical protein